MDKKCIFGRIHNGEMQLNKYGKIVHDSWKWLEQQYDYIRLHEFIIMPNHMHGIIEITNVGARGKAPHELIGGLNAPPRVKHCWVLLWGYIKGWF